MRFFEKLSAAPADAGRLANSFDDAWLTINQNAPIPPQDRSAAQERLGAIILRNWKRDPSGSIVTRSVAAFFAEDALKCH